MSEQQKSTQMTIHANQDLGFSFYDMFNILAGPEEVVIELGNHNRFKQGEATIHHRAVLSASSAVKLMQAMQQALSEVQNRMRERRTEIAKGD